MEWFYRANIHNNPAPLMPIHYGLIKWRHFPHYWPFWGESTGHRWIPLTKTSDAELWCFNFICAWTNGWGNNLDAGDLKRYHTHYECKVSQQPCTNLLVVVSSLSVGIQIWKRLFSCCDESTQRNTMYQDFCDFLRKPVLYKTTVMIA